MLHPFWRTTASTESARFGRGRLLLRAAREIFIFQGIWEFQPRVFRCLSLLPPSFLFPLSSPSSPIPSRPPLF